VNASPPSEQKGAAYNLLTSLVLILPLFLVYQVGVLLTWPFMNGADLFTRILVQHLNLTGYLIWNLLTAGLIVAIAQSRRKEGVQFDRIIPCVIESALYAFFLGSVIIFVMSRVLHIPPPAAAAGGIENASVLARLIMSCGAGVHEELVFRLLMMNGIVALFAGMKFKPLEAFLVALVVSSVLFSLAHHVGEMGDRFTVWTFTFRLLAGVIFGVIYWIRGFAVAVYTHALYDMYVLLLRS
jgi:hypothetical protein